MTNKLVSKYSFEMPDVGDITTLTVSNCASISPNCWIWNTSVGYLEVIDFKDPEVTVRNLGRIENAKAGSEFPSCMEFLIVAPDSLPLYDPTVTCLAADFISPEVNETGIMVVVDTSKIRETDVLIIDRKYRYTVVAVIDEHQLEVRNEGHGKEPGEVIDVVCDECISVKILESTYCCKVVREELQEEIDDINDRLNTKKSILASDLNNLVTVSGGSHVQTDAPYDTVIYVDDDLSNYNNNNSKFITMDDVGNGHLYINDPNGNQLADFTANQFGNTTFTIPSGNITSSDNSVTVTNGNKAALHNVDLKVPAKDITSSDNSISVTGGTGASLKGVDLKVNFPPSPVIPNVYDGHLNITVGGTTYTFTANQPGNTNISIPSVPTVPTVYSGYSVGSGLMRWDYDQDLSGDSYNLINTSTSGSPTTKNATLDSVLPSITIASPSLSGHNMMVYGSVFIRCSGTFHTDTHTYPDSGYHSLVTTRGPTTELTVKTYLNSSPMYNHSTSSGESYHLALDKLGTTSAELQSFSQQVTIPIICEVTPSNTNTITFTGKLTASGLRDAGGSSSNPDTFYNENVRVYVKHLQVFVALGWVIK